MSQRIITLDVREDIHEGREPFSRIMQALARLGADEALLLIAPFEPVPLLGLSARQGFSHKSRATSSGDWEVVFSRGTAPEGPGPLAPASEMPAFESHSLEMVDVDARGLEPPQPLVTILQALATLPDGAELRARTDRRPMHLYAHLEDRGFVGETDEAADGGFITHVRRR